MPVVPNNIASEEEHGRQIKPIVTNTLADGSGDWIFPAGMGDPVSGNAIAIENSHATIHSGDSFSCHYNQTVSDINDRSIIAFKTPNTLRFIHAIFFAFASTAADAYIYEAPTITDNTGASLTVFNRRRPSTTETTVIRTNTNPDEVGAMFFTEITMGDVTGGTELTHKPLVEGQGQKAVGGEDRGTEEWILKPNTLYAFEIKSSTALDNVHLLEIDFYETTEV